MRYKMTLDYMGTAYCGWQIQPDKDTVQGRVEKALYALTAQKSTVTGSGRTDAGVHALCQSAHFDLPQPWETAKLKSGMNHYLPSDIRVLCVERVWDNFHARFDCVDKTYRYLMYRGDKRAVFQNRAWAVHADSDVEKMRAAAKEFVGEKDFRAFMGGGAQVKTTVRTVTQASVQEREGFIIFEVTANGFLYNMVRIMTAVLESAGRGVTDAATVKKLLQEGDRTKVKGLAPAYGLYLVRQRYHSYPQETSIKDI